MAEHVTFSVSGKRSEIFPAQLFSQVKLEEKNIDDLFAIRLAVKIWPTFFLSFLLYGKGGKDVPASFPVLFQ